MIIVRGIQIEIIDRIRIKTRQLPSCLLNYLFAPLVVLLWSEVNNLEVNSLELVKLGRHGAHMVLHFVPFPWYEFPLDVRDVNEHGVRRECGIVLKSVGTYSIIIEGVHHRSL